VGWCMRRSGADIDPYGQLLALAGVTLFERARLLALR
jgi:hypothetical protein